MPLNDSQWTELAAALKHAFAPIAPDWTDANAGDPGVTVLELLAFALADLQARGTTLDDHGRRIARLLARHADALANPGAGTDDDCGSGLQRVHFASGMLLGVDDLRTEQEYVRRRLARRNRLMLGSGIATGLEVTVDHGGSGAGRLVVAPGLALAPDGNEIEIERPVTLALPAIGPALHVLLRYAERPCRTVPLLVGASPDTAAAEPTRIVEAFEVGLAPAPAADAVVLARLGGSRGRWRLDPAFRPVHVRPFG